MRSEIANLTHRSARDAARYGGKGAGLARLVSMGLDVPAGFVISTRIFSDYIEELALDVGNDPIHVVVGIGAGDFSTATKRRLSTAYSDLGGSVAVRSSLVGEDGLNASLAGQLESVLAIRGEEEFFAAIKRCYASAFSPRVAKYRMGLGHRRGSEPLSKQRLELPEMALVVQRMQLANVAGVAFSADPINGRRCVVIEGDAGHIDGVASGTVVPSRWVVDARGEISEAWTENGDSPPLANSQVLDLAHSVRQIAAAFCCPVDVEWLHDGDRFWFLQARPITSLQGKRIYSSRLVADMSPGLIKPLLWSTNTQAITHNVFGRLFTELIGPNDINFSLLVRRIYSRLYTDVTQLGELLTKVGLPANLFEMMARDEHAERQRLSWRKAPLLLRYAPFLLRHLRMAGPIRRFLDDQDGALDLFRQTDWSSGELADLPLAAERLLELHGRSQWFVFLAAFNSMLRRRLLERYVRRNAPGIEWGDLLLGLSGRKALEPNDMLQTAGEVARRLPPEQLELLGNGDDTGIRGSLQHDKSGGKLLALIDEFMGRYGFLSANGTDFSEASWVEDPTLIWQSVARYARAEPVPSVASFEALRHEAVVSVETRLPPLRRALFRRFLQSTSSYLDLRERVSFLFAEDTFELRRVLLAMGEKLVEMKKLQARDDVFYLFKAELWKLVDGDLKGAEAQLLVEKRRIEMKRDADREPEETLCGETDDIATLPPLDSEYLVGIGCSPGTVSGYARIVRDPLQAPPDLCQSDILVVPFTDVGWTPLFSGIGGIVAEAGGQLSHTAIVAREYRLPAVVGVRRAMREIQPGESITLDGRRGRVYRGHILASEGSRT